MESIERPVWDEMVSLRMIFNARSLHLSVWLVLPFRRKMSWAIARARVSYSLIAAVRSFLAVAH